MWVKILRVNVFWFFVIGNSVVEFLEFLRRFIREGWAFCRDIVFDWDIVIIRFYLFLG